MKRFLYDNDLSELPAGIFDKLVELDYLCVGMSKKGRAGTDGMAVDGRLAWPAGVAMWWGFGRLSLCWALAVPPPPSPPSHGSYPYLPSHPSSAPSPLPPLLHALIIIIIIIIIITTTTIRRGWLRLRVCGSWWLVACLASE